MTNFGIIGKRVLFVIGMCSFWLGGIAQNKVKHVEVRKNNQDEFRLYVDNSEFYVKGVGGTDHMDVAASIGANTIRTWSSDNARAILDEAQKHGLMVMMGLWVQHERHGFDYDDEAKIKNQLEQFRKVVLEIKDHPALLLWGVGNEVDLFYTNTKVWNAVQDIAKMIHELDPNHPTTTVTAGLDPNEVDLIKHNAPDIDIYSVNTYGGIGDVRKNIRSYGWTGPYLITEWGPNGHWEVAKTPWGSPIEQTSSEKAVSYQERYQKEILGDSQYCMGSFVFLWGHKQETTSTWYGLFDEEGRISQAIDVLHQEWSPSTMKSHAPRFEYILLNDLSCIQAPSVWADDEVFVKCNWIDSDHDVNKVIWNVVPESNDIKAGGDAEAAPMPVQGIWKKRGDFNATFRAPHVPGAYRVFVQINDNQNHYAYANIPFEVKARSADMPLPRWINIKTWNDGNWKE
jgi:hypothetical protein